MFIDEIIIKIIGKYTNDFEEQLKLKKILEEELNNYEITSKSTDLITSDILEKASYFIAVKKLEGVSSGTLKNYKYDFLRLADAIHKPVSIITDVDIKIYLSSFKVKQSTLSSRISNLKAFFIWLHEEEYITKNPMRKIKSPKLPKKLREGLTAMELEITREACRTDRERALIEFLFSTGCRASEVRMLKITDVDFNKNQAVVFGKGSKERVVFFTDKAKLLILNYIDNRKQESEYVFTRSKGPATCLSLRSIEYIITKVAERTNIHLFPHKLRHTFCTFKAEAGMDMAVLKEIMGHESLDTTQRYYSVSKSRIKSEYNRLS